MERLVRDWIKGVEEAEYPWHAYVLTFLGILLFRILLEHFSSGIPLYSQSIFHVFSWFLCSFVILLGLTSAFSGNSLGNVAKLIVTLSPMILSPALIDMLPIPGNEAPMGYIPIRSAGDIWTTYSQLGGPKGMTLGIKIEVVLILIACFSYLRLRGKSFINCIGFVLIVYTYLYSMGIAPVFIDGLFSCLGIPVEQKIQTYSRIYLFISSILGIIYISRANADLIRIFWKDIRLIRIFHYLIMFALGAALFIHTANRDLENASHLLQKEALLQTQQNRLETAVSEGFDETYIQNISDKINELQAGLSSGLSAIGYSSLAQLRGPFLNSYNVTAFLFFVLSIFFCAVFAIVVNNIEDYEIDRISNPNRPLPQHSISPKSYHKWGLVCFAVGLVMAALAGPLVFYFICLLSLGYFIYSAPPLKLKRVPFLAKLILAINSFFMVLLGFMMMGGQLPQFPPNWLFFLLVPVALSGNFLDIKDYDGDKAGGIRTLPVLMGLKNSKILITIFSLFAYFTFYYIIGLDWVIYLLLPKFIVHAYLLNAEVYREKLIFLVYYSALLGMIGILLLF